MSIMKKKYYVISILFIIIIIQLINLMYFKHDYFLESLYSKTNLYVEGVAAPRGKILDVNGEVLVDNKAINTVYYHKLDNFTLEDELEISYKLATLMIFEVASVEEQENFYLALNSGADFLLTEEEKELYEKRLITSEEILNLKKSRIDLSDFNSLDKEAAHIYDLMLSGYDYETKVLKTGATDEEFALVAEANIKGITAEVSWERYYPYEDTLKSIFGSVGPIFKEEEEYYEALGYSKTDLVGISFLEKEYENYLKGSNSIYKVNSDGSLKLVKNEEPGKDIYLSIDINIQLKLEKVMKEEMSIAITKPNTQYFSDTFSVITNPLTGSILAISGLKITEVRNEIEFKDITNEILTSSFTLGSSVKGATITVGYNNGLIDIDKNIYDSCVKLEFVPSKCSWEPLGYINDITALKDSSNYYQYLIAIGLTGNTYTPNMVLNSSLEDFKVYRDTLAEFGLGELTGIDLPVEHTGTKGELVSDDLLLNLAIGQYDTYTLLQLVQYINTLANNKERLSLSLLDKVVSEDELLYVNQNEVLSMLSVEDKYYERIIAGLNEVVESGTGYGYIDAKYDPVGKTGTSESFLDTDMDGNVDVKTVSLSFAGYAPLDNPKYSIAIISPHIAYQEGDDDYIYRVSRYISRDITDFLFENY